MVEPLFSPLTSSLNEGSAIVVRLALPETSARFDKAARSSSRHVLHQGEGRVQSGIAVPIVCAAPRDQERLVPRIVATID